MGSAATRPRDEKGRFLAGPPVDLDAARADYEAGGLKLPEIAEKYRISQSALHRLTVAGRWVPRAPRRVDPNDLVMRMLDVLGTQLGILEKADMKDKNVAAEAAVLGRLATTLDKLIEMKRAEAKRQPRAQSNEMAALREKIAERIAELNAD
jgi:hypothetical protein